MEPLARAVGIIEVVKAVSWLEKEILPRVCDSDAASRGSRLHASAALMAVWSDSGSGER